MRLFIVLLVVHQIFADTELTDKSFASGLNGFSFEFARQLDYKNENIIFSPLSIATVMGMLLEAPKSEAGDKIYKALNMDQYSNKDTIHKHFKNLINEYKDMATRDENPRNVTIEIANALLVAEKYNLATKFTDALKENYEASVASENFATNGEQVKEKINKFVKERTHELIPQILSEKLSPDTIMAIINTLYFEGFWQKPFHKPSTIKEPFNNADKTQTSVDMMTKPASYYKYYHCTVLNASIIELEYLGDVSMFVVVPDETYGLPKLVEGWTKDKLASYLPQMKNTRVHIHLPKFDIERKVDLLKVMSKMGADIRPALKSLDPHLDISEGFHQARIQVTEAGTKAAAVTFLSVTRTSAINLPEPLHLKVDRPFMYCIRDMKSHVNLFCGLVNKL